MARGNGAGPDLPYRWRRMMLEGGSVAVTEEE
ncbi:transposase [[Luteovulum] sphaeroides subsp. megalophilum]|nr:transposase [[Luteovulum] sphaeroides subsp. megalophilum]